MCFFSRFSGRLGSGGYRDFSVRWEVTDHGQNPDDPAADIPQSGPVDTHQDNTSILAYPTFVNRPRVGLGLKHPRKTIHVTLAIFRMSEANVGLGQQFLGRITGDVTELLVDPGEAEGGRIGLEHADTGKLEDGTESCFAIHQLLPDFPQQQERDLLRAHNGIHLMVLQSIDDGLGRGEAVFKLLICRPAFAHESPSNSRRASRTLGRSLRFPRTVTLGSGATRTNAGVIRMLFLSAAAKFFSTSIVSIVQRP